MTTSYHVLIVMRVACFSVILGLGQCFQQQQRTIAKRHGSTSLYVTRANDVKISSGAQQRSSYLATCVPGLAHVLQRELEDLRTTIGHPDGITDVVLSGNAAVTFEATREASLYALCWLRSAHRLLEIVATTDEINGLPKDEWNTDKNSIDRNSLLYTRDDLHNFVRECVNAKDLLGDGNGGLLTLSVKAILNNPRQLPKDLSHSHYTALSIKNSLCDIVRDLRQDRPDVDVDNPDVPLVAILRGMGDNRYDEGAASLSIYRSLHPPGSLHKRGYRAGGAMHKAAMKESMAAGLLLEAGWKEKVESVIKIGEQDQRDNLPNGSHYQLRMIDPMAGSGSLVLEACMMATDIAPGLMRIRCGIPNHSNPPVTRWKSNDGEDINFIWKRVLLDATKRAKAGIQRMREYPSLIQIEANDIHPRAVDMIDSSLNMAGLRNFVRLSNLDCYDLDGGKRLTDNDDSNPGTCDCFVTTNPPWGVRLSDDITESWEGLRHFIRDKCPDGTQVYILSGDKTATAALKLKRDRMIPLQTGDQHLRWIQYTIGRKKKGNKFDRGTQNNSRKQSGHLSKHSQHDKFENKQEASPEDSWV